ncbi:proteoglycan 4-like isoform X4 [Anneissia japonica]|uniref:proteoglycan 4-like isoform X4 n=1 Tax=Anneissia japonica TaxID=1529436 RepID=UPI0014257991|nr:proteoglycan 4-like isoform X4 [Anneissia japonica]
MPGRKRSIKSRLSKRSKAPPPPQTLKTDQNMPDMDTTNGHAATRSGKSSTNGTKPKPNTRNLRVHMPNGKIVQATVDANLSSSDLLVMMAGKNKLNPVSHMMKVPSSSPLEESVLLKPSQCVGDINGDIVFLIAKPQKEQYTIKGVERKTAKFERLKSYSRNSKKTIRLTVNYGTKHKMVLRINPDRTLADLLPQICEEKGVDPQHHTLRLPKSPSDNLDLSKSLTSYEINELQLVDTRVPNHVRVMILTAPKQEPSVMPELVGKKKSFFQKWKKKQSGFDVEQAPVAVAKPEVTSPTSPTRQRPATISATRVPLKDNTQISRTQTTKKRAAPKPPTPNEAAAVTAKAASRKKKAPAPPRPDGGMKSPTTDDPPKRLPDADHNMPHSSVSNEESVEAEVHSKPTDEEPVSPGNLNRIHSQRPLSPPPPPPEADDTAQFILPTPTTSPELKVDRPTFIAPPPPDEPPPEEETDDQSVCSSQNSDIEDDEAENHQAVVDVGAIASGQRHVECTCNQETGEHECILHRPQTPEGAVACAAELEAGELQESGSPVETNGDQSDLNFQTDNVLTRELSVGSSDSKMVTVSSSASNASDDLAVTAPSNTSNSDEGCSTLNTDSGAYCNVKIVQNFKPPRPPKPQLWPQTPPKLPPKGASKKPVPRPRVSMQTTQQVERFTANGQPVAMVTPTTSSPKPTAPPRPCRPPNLSAAVAANTDEMEQGTLIQTPAQTDANTNNLGSLHKFAKQVAKDEELKKEEVDTLSSELINDKAVKEDAESIEVTVDGIENIPSQDDDKKVDVGLEDATLKLNADDENAVAIQEESSTKEDDKEVSENEKIVENSDVEINEISGTGIVNSLDVETSKQLTEEVKEDIKEEQKEDGERIDQIKQLNGESSEVSNITNGDVIPVTQKTNETEIQMKELKDKYETLQQQFATLQQQMINSQQNMLEQQKAQAGAPSLSAQDMLALQTQQMQQMQQLIQQQMLLQSQGMMKMPQIPVAMQPDSHAITPVPAETMIHKEDTKPPKPHDLQELKKSEPHSEDSKKLRSPETEKDLASAFRSLKPKPKPMKHSYIFSAARKPRSESDASQSSNMAGYEMRKRSESNPEPQQPPAIKPSETVKPSEAVKPTENINVIQENGDAEKKTPKEAIVHPNVIIIDKPEDNLKSETSVLSGRSSTIPQATVAPQPAKKSSGRTGKFIAYRNPRTEELQDIQTSGSVSKFRQMFAGNNT